MHQSSINDLVRLVFDKNTLKREKCFWSDVGWVKVFTKLLTLEDVPVGLIAFQIFLLILHEAFYYRRHECTLKTSWEFLGAWESTKTYFELVGWLKSGGWSGSFRSAVKLFLTENDLLTLSQTVRRRCFDLANLGWKSTRNYYILVCNSSAIMK